MAGGRPRGLVWLHHVDQTARVYQIFAPKGPTPPAPRGREIALPADSLQPGPGGRLDRVASAGQYLELLPISPDTGTWRLTTRDGTPTDESQWTDGGVVNALEMMRPAGDGPPPPEEYRANDVVVWLATRSMEYYAVRLEP